MTPFDKNEFHFDGMYLMYEGDHELAETYEQPCHPSREGTLRPTFIARFKYRKNWKTWMNFICKNFTVEEYVRLERETSPLQAMMSKGFKE